MRVNLKRSSLDIRHLRTSSRLRSAKQVQLFSFVNDYSFDLTLRCVFLVMKQMT